VTVPALDVPALATDAREDQRRLRDHDAALAEAALASARGVAAAVLDRDL
jgi:hypothetical protein